MLYQNLSSTFACILHQYWRGEAIFTIRSRFQFAHFGNGDDMHMYSPDRYNSNPCGCSYKLYIYIIVIRKDGGAQFIAPGQHQPNAKLISILRGEGRWGAKGGPLWSLPSCCPMLYSLHETRAQN